MATHLDVGQRAEAEAAKLLRHNRLRIIERNFRCRFGEIDIIALSKSHLIFVEVRHRSNTKHGSGAESVDFRKQQRIMQTAQFFLSSGRYRNLPCRFDVIESTLDQHGQLQLHWLQNAFQ
jgi:putative endonuclease